MASCQEQEGHLGNSLPESQCEMKQQEEALPSPLPAAAAALGGRDWVARPRPSPAGAQESSLCPTFSLGVQFLVWGPGGSFHPTGSPPPRAPDSTPVLSTPGLCWPPVRPVPWPVLPVSPRLRAPQDQREAPKVAGPQRGVGQSPAPANHCGVRTWADHSSPDRSALPGGPGAPGTASGVGGAPGGRSPARGTGTSRA